MRVKNHIIHDDLAMDMATEHALPIDSLKMKEIRVVVLNTIEAILNDRKDKQVFRTIAKKFAIARAFIAQRQITGELEAFTLELMGEEE